MLRTAVDISTVLTGSRSCGSNNADRDGIYTLRIAKAIDGGHLAQRRLLATARRQGRRLVGCAYFVRKSNWLRPEVTLGLWEPGNRDPAENLEGFRVFGPTFFRERQPMI